ncbi:hypothetical protein [Desulfovibrio cuneatus]|uniref:hypothetical protein n=1 Tax=Desulfovibrio cuneatus TaxID=159728 RepID=UPI000426A50C|nr:hypothetical protein [Desulfovibrio cuneatus]
MKEVKEAMLSFRVTEEEKQQLKVLAAKEKKTLKALVFDALEKMFPHWKESK